MKIKIEFCFRYNWNENSQVQKRTWFLFDVYEIDSFIDLMTIKYGEHQANEWIITLISNGLGSVLYDDLHKFTVVNDDVSYASLNGKELNDQIMREARLADETS